MQLRKRLCFGSDTTILRHNTVRTTVFELNGGELISRVWESDTYSSECHQDILYDFIQFVGHTSRWVLSNFNQFVTPMWLWCTWRNFHFVTLPGGLWQGPNFVRWHKFWQELPYSGHMWQITLSSSSPVTCDHDLISFRQMALWHVTDKLIEIGQYTIHGRPRWI